MQSKNPPPKKKKKKKILRENEIGNIINFKYNFPNELKLKSYWECGKQETANQI